MTIQRIALALALSGAFVSLAQAADTPVMETSPGAPVMETSPGAPVMKSDTDTAGAVVDTSMVRPAMNDTATPAARVETNTIRPGFKTRDDVIAEVVRAKQNGTYVEVNEGYPARFGLPVR